MSIHFSMQSGKRLLRKQDVSMESFRKKETALSKSRDLMDIINKISKQ